MRLLVLVLAVLVGGSTGQNYYSFPRAPLRPIAPFGICKHPRILTLQQHPNTP